MAGAERYGNYYICIKVAKPLSWTGESYAYADEIEVTPHGDLILWCHRQDEKTGERQRAFINLALSAGQWIVFYAASGIDGERSPLSIGLAKSRTGTITAATIQISSRPSLRANADLSTRIVRALEEKD